MSKREVACTGNGGAVLDKSSKESGIEAKETCVSSVVRFRAARLAVTRYRCWFTAARRAMAEAKRLRAASSSSALMFALRSWSVRVRDGVGGANINASKSRWNNVPRSRTALTRLGNLTEM